VSDNVDTTASREQRRADLNEQLETEVEERVMRRRAREREHARRAGRPERGLFTGHGRRSRSRNDDDDYDREPRRRRSHGFFHHDSEDDDIQPRAGAKRSVMRAITQLPAYLRLLVGLITDSRVSKVDRFFVLGAVVYIISPIDLIPDVIPFFGEVDDVFLLMLALQRLVNNAGRSVVLSHWKGDPDELDNLNFARIISAAGFFLPNSVKKRLLKMVGLGGKRRS
jgi:uncharacterized membrane protein YkvA (DUF1232 family)